jgi:glycosyltransferase involved in cell wall biosynthesis
MVIWIEVADLFDYAAQHARPTGIQRMALEIAAALRQAGGDGRIRFVCYKPKGQAFLEVEWAEIRDLFAAGPQLAARPAVVRTGGAPPPRERDAVRAWLAEILPPDFRLALGRAARSQIASWAALAAAGVALWRAATRKQRTVGGRPAAFSAGDMLLSLGSPWGFADYPARLDALRRQGVRLAAFVHDMIPLRRPEWCYPGTTRDFLRWFTATAPLCEYLFVASEATARDIALSAQRHAIPLPARIRRVPIGTGFTAPPGPALPHLPQPGSYVLFVSTIEPRKNHALLVRVWQHLLETRPRGTVPKLVFAGRAGWMVGDLLQQLENAAHLDSHVLRVEGASDTELAALYRGCLFTLYPSLYEGWGLPVAESLAFGKPCIAADATSLPEAGGTLARYFDPDNLHDAIRVIAGVIDDPAGLAAWTVEVARAFRPVPWSDTAREMLAAIEEPT